MKYIRQFLLLNLFFFIGFSMFAQASKDNDYEQLWRECGLVGIIDYELFYAAMQAKAQFSFAKPDVMTIIDYSQASVEERFFVIDVDKRKLLYHSLVAHGVNSGENFALRFSDKPNSRCSSLGMYRTGEMYYGKYGLSLRLYGLEPGINGNALRRSIVIHGADYVSREFIRKYGRLGRSWGCPALPKSLASAIIRCIAGGSLLFIYADDEDYKNNTRFWNVSPNVFSTSP